MSERAAANVALVGLGKMGISHLAIANASRRINVTAICDTSALLGQMVERHCKIPYVSDYAELVKQPGLDAVVIATPTRVHDPMVRAAFSNGLNVFCEKPLTLSSLVSDEFSGEARRLGLVAQVGYHNRFVATFAEAKRLIDLGAIGTIRHVLAEAYGAVVLKPQGKTWRSQASNGGGCLYDYAAHPINLMNWYVGRPVECLGAELQQQYSAEVDDAVYTNLRFASGATGQVSVNWSDETVRKMSTKITIWGDGGRIAVDRQEIQVFVGATGTAPDGYGKGWTIKYITDITPNVDYYLRGEEYSAQMEAFGDAVIAKSPDCVNDFASAAETDYTLELIRSEAIAERPTKVFVPAAIAAAPQRRGVLGRVLGR